VRILRRLAELLEGAGSIDAAIRTLEEAIAVARSNELLRFYLPESLRALGALWQQQGELLLAYSAYREALRILEEQNSDGTYLKSVLTLELGKLLLDLGDLAGAEHMLRLSLDCRARRHGLPDSATAEAYAELATCLIEQFRWREAVVACFRGARRVARQPRVQVRGGDDAASGRPVRA
jgi:tetratricopeptide (TPR) repeat protein